MINKEIEQRRKKLYFLRYFNKEGFTNRMILYRYKSNYDIAKEIVALLKTKELTYEEAYASLELSRNVLEYESKIVKI